MIGVNEYLPGALVAIAAFGALELLSRRPCGCRDCRPRPDRPPDPVRWELRRGPGRELERWRGGSGS